MMNNKPYAPSPFSLSQLKGTVQKFWRLWRKSSPSSLLDDRSLMDVLSLMWRNFTQTRTHAYYTGVAPGRWGDAHHRLETVMTTALVRFLEGDWYNNKRALADRDLPEDPDPDLVIQLLEKNIEWREGQESPAPENAARAQKALEAYRYLTKYRPRLTTIIDELDDRTELSMSDDGQVEGQAEGVHSITFESSNEVWSDRRTVLEAHRHSRDKETIEKIGEIVSWMWA